MSDDSTPDGSPNAVLILVFTSEGGAVLEEDAEGVWFSDDDDDFHEHFADDFLDADTDARDVLNWLEEHGWIDPDEIGNVGIEQEVNNDGEDEDTEQDESTLHN